MKTMTQGNIHKAFLGFSVPLIFSSLLAQAYSTVDLIIAGQTIGDEALAALGATSSLFSFLILAVSGFSTGCAVFSARLYGGKEYKRLKGVLGTTMFIITSAALLITLGLFVFQKPIFSFLKVDPLIAESAKTYYLIYAAGIAIYIFNGAANHFLSGFGHTMYVFIVSAISGLLNVAGNLVAVLVLKIGVAGLAYATVFSALVSTVLYTVKILKCFAEMKVQDDKFINFRAFEAALPYALPVMFQQTAMYFAGFLLSPIVNALGKSATAAYSVASKVFNIVIIFMQSCTRAISTYTLQCLGEDKPEKINRGIAVGYLYANLLSLPAILVCMIFPGAICSVFFSGEDFQSLGYAIEFCRYYLIFSVFYGTNNMFHNVYRSFKKMALLFTSSLFGAFSRVVFSYFLAERFGMSGFFMGWALSWFAEAVLSMTVFFTGLWIPAEYKKTIGFRRRKKKKAEETA